MKTIVQTSLALLILGGLPLAASAQAVSTIYADQFAGAAGTALNGHAPTNSTGGFGGTAGATWAATSNLTLNGAGQLNYTTDTNQDSGTGFLPFTPQTGYVYTLTANVINLSGNTLTSLGFVAAPTPTTAAFWYRSENDAAADWLYVNSGSSQEFGGPATDNQIYTSIGGNGTYTITLNTTAPAWSYSFTGPDNTTLGGTYTTNPTIGGVGFGSMFSKDDGVVESQYGTFSLAVAVPEPSTWALLAVSAGASALSFHRRLSRVG